MEENWKAIIQHQEQIIKSQWKIIEDLEKKNKELQNSSFSAPAPANNAAALSPAPQPPVIKTVAAAPQAPRISRQVNFAVQVPTESPEVEQEEQQEQEQQPEDPSEEPTQAAFGAGPRDGSILNDTQIPKISTIRGISLDKTGGDWSGEQDGYSFFIGDELALLTHGKEEIIYYFADARLAELLLRKINLSGVTVRTVLRQEIEGTSTNHSIPAFLVELNGSSLSYSIML